MSLKQIISRLCDYTVQTCSPTAPVGPGFQWVAFKCDTTGSCSTSLALCAVFKALAGSEALTLHT